MFHHGYRTEADKPNACAWRREERSSRWRDRPLCACYFANAADGRNADRAAVIGIESFNSSRPCCFDTYYATYRRGAMSDDENSIMTPRSRSTAPMPWRALVKKLAGHIPAPISISISLSRRPPLQHVNSETMLPSLMPGLFENRRRETLSASRKYRMPSPWREINIMRRRIGMASSSSVRGTAPRRRDPLLVDASMRIFSSWQERIIAAFHRRRITIVSPRRRAGT